MKRILNWWTNYKKYRRRREIEEHYQTVFKMINLDRKGYLALMTLKQADLEKEGLT